MGRRDGGDEKLGAVGVGARVGHGQSPGSAVLEFEVFVRELLAVDGLAAGAVAAGEVAALDHEVLDDAVERGALVPEPALARRKRRVVGEAGWGSLETNRTACESTVWDTFKELTRRALSTRGGST